MLFKVLLTLLKIILLFIQMFLYLNNFTFSSAIFFVTNHKEDKTIPETIPHNPIEFRTFETTLNLEK